jgi:hypothetical protein
LWSPKDLLFVGRTAFGLADPVLGTLTAIEADAEVRVPDELLPACPEDELPPVKDTPEGEPPPPEVVEVETPPPPPAFAPARAPKPPTPLLSSPEFAVICLAIAVLVTSFVALGYVLGK